MELETGEELQPAPQQPDVSIDIVIAQIKPKKADYGHNLAHIGEVMQQLAQEKTPCDVLVLPETVTTGYFLEGGVREMAVTREQLLVDLRNEYVRSGLQKPLDIVIGFYELGDGNYYNSGMYASLAPELAESKIVHVHRKFFLPTYGVFDEQRFVSKGRAIQAFDTRFGRAVILICEDIWHSISATIAALKGAHLFYVLTASPGRGFKEDVIGNAAKYRQLLVAIAEEHNVFAINSSLVGFEGGKGFIGHSAVFDPFGNKLVEGPLAEEAILTTRITLDDLNIARANLPLLGDLETNLADISLEIQRIVQGMDQPEK
jgi:predicted amidohydrolase